MNLSGVAKRARNLSKQYEAVIELIEEVTALGNLESHAQFLQNAIEAKEKQITFLEEKATEVRAKLAKATGDLKSAEIGEASANHNAKDAMNKALNQATAQAKNIVKAAEKAASDITGEQEKSRVNHNRFMAKSKIEAEHMRKTIANLTDEFTKMRERLSL